MFDQVHKFLYQTFIDILGFALQIFGIIVDWLDENIDLVDTYAAIFLTLAGTFLVCVVLWRVITTMYNSAYGSEVTATHIILDAIKASASIPIMAFIQTFSQRFIVIPLVKFLFNEQAMFSLDTLEDIKSIGSVELSKTVTNIFLLFFVIVLIAFFIKICIYYVEMIFFNLSIPWVAITIATESSDFSKSWWRNYLKMTVTLIAQVLSLTLLVYSVGNLSNGMQYVLLMIGSGCLILKAPLVLQEIWASTGATKGIGGTIKQFVMNKIMFSK